ncbi:unnamed protein product [Arabidopsis halleri]
MLQRRCIELSFHKYGRNVVEKLFRDGKSVVALGIFSKEIVKSDDDEDTLVKLAKDEYGSKVLKNILEFAKMCRIDLFCELVEKLKPFVDRLRGHPETLPDTIIETSPCTLLSDAGGAFAHRRREIFCLFRPFSLSVSLRAFLLVFILFCNPFLLPFLFSCGVSLHGITNTGGFPADLIRVGRLLASEFGSKDSKSLTTLAAPCHYRIPLKSNLSSPCSLMEWSSALTWKPVMTLVDPSLPNNLPIASSPYRRGGSINTFPTEATLGFCLLGPYHCCGPLTSLSRPIYRSCCGPTPIFDWTRYVISNLSLSPLIRLLRYFIWNGRGHYSSFVSTPLHWLSDYQSRVQAPSIVPTANLPSVAPGSLVVVICYLALAVNSWDWLGLVQPCVSSSDMYVAFPCAPPAIGISRAGFVLNCVCTRIQTGSLFNGQSLPSWALPSIYMTSEGIVSVTLCCGVHRPSNSLLLVLNYLSPRSSIGVLCGVDGLCAGLGFTEEDICVIKSQLIQPPSQKIEAFLSFSDAARLQSTICFGLGWCFKDPLSGKIHGGSFSRPFVSSVLVAEALALKAAITAALALGVSRLACISDCLELVLLPNTGGHANELDGKSADFDLFRSMILSMSVHFIPRCENCGADALAKASSLSCIPSSISGV